MADIEQLTNKTKTAFQKYKNAELTFHNYHFLLNEAKSAEGISILPERKTKVAKGAVEGEAPAPSEGAASRTAKAAKAGKGKKRAKPSAAPAEGQEEAFVCAGNVISGDECPGGDDSDVKASSTRGPDGKLHPTCKKCKTAMKKQKRKKE